MKTNHRYLFALAATLFALACPLTSLAQAENSLESSCIDISFTQESGMSPRDYKAYLDAQDINAGISEVIRTRAWANAWFTLKVPHAYPRTVGIYQAINVTFGVYGIGAELKSTPEEWLDQALEFFSDKGLERARTLTPIPDILGTPITPDQMHRDLTSKRSQDESSLGHIMKTFPFLTALSCIGIDSAHNFKCQSAVKYAFNNLYDSGNTYNLGNGWLVDLLTNDSSAKGGFRLVHKMLERIKNHDFNHASLIDDAYASFDDKKTAETFLLLGLIHGQLSFDSYRADGLVQRYNFNSIIAAHVMSMLSATLDQNVYEHTPEKRIYVSPLGMKNVCDNGKPYHFLVPWYIGRRLTEKGYNRTIASKVPFLFDWMYQNFSKSRGRDPIENVNSAYDDENNQSHRVDLLYSAAGANLGSGLSTNESSVDFTQAFDQTQENVPAAVRPVQNMQQQDSLGMGMLIKLFHIGEKRFSPADLLQSTR